MANFLTTQIGKMIMESSLTFMFAALLMVFSLFTSPTSGVTQETLASICSQTQNQEICEGILESDPGTTSADLHGLSLISINLTMKQGSSNYDTFTKFMDNSTDTALKESFRNCVSLYNSIMEMLKVAYQLSEKKEYESITQPGESQTLAYNCANGLPIDSPTDGISRDMIITCETSASVNQYIVGVSLK